MQGAEVPRLFYVVFLPWMVSVQSLYDFQKKMFILFAFFDKV